MKDRKTLPMQSLINETIRQLAHRFTPSLPMVKQAIERLIDKEYLERNENDRKSLNYLVRPPPFFTLRNQRILIPSFSVAIGLKRVCVVLHSYPPSLLVTLLYIPPCPCRRPFSSRPPSPVSNSDSAAQASSIFAHCSSLHSLLFTRYSLLLSKSRRITTRLSSLINISDERRPCAPDSIRPPLTISSIRLPSLETRQDEHEPT